jgi:hypothetical protein
LLLKLEPPSLSRITEALAFHSRVFFGDGVIFSSSGRHCAGKSKSLHLRPA